MQLTAKLDGPIKTTVVQNQRCMTTWALQNASANDLFGTLTTTNAPRHTTNCPDLQSLHGSTGRK